MELTRPHRQCGIPKFLDPVVIPFYDRLVQKLNDLFLLRQRLLNPRLRRFWYINR